MSARDDLPALICEQPSLPPDLICLKARYLHDELYLDLWGTWDADDGFDVVTAALTGQAVDIGCLLRPEQLRQMSDALDRAAFRERDRAKQEARADAAMWERMQV